MLSPPIEPIAEANAFIAKHRGAVEGEQVADVGLVFLTNLTSKDSPSFRTLTSEIYIHDEIVRGRVRMLAMTLPSIAGLVPFLPGGLGTVDATMVSVFLLFGVPLEIAISATLIERAISLVLSTLVGACALSYLGIKVWARGSD